MKYFCLVSAVMHTYQNLHLINVLNIKMSTCTAPTQSLCNGFTRRASALLLQSKVSSGEYYTDNEKMCKRLVGTVSLGPSMIVCSQIIYN